MAKNGENGKPLKMMEGLRRALRATPFREFVVTLLNGDVVPVRHPEMVFISPRDLVVVELDGDSFTYFEPVSITAIRVHRSRTPR